MAAAGEKRFTQKSTGKTFHPVTSSHRSGLPGGGAPLLLSPLLAGSGPERAGEWLRVECLPARAAPPVVMSTATTTPADGAPFRSTHTPMLSVKSGRQRLKTTYIGRLRPRSDHSVSVDCSVDRTHTGANSCTCTRTHTHMHAVSLGHTPEMDYSEAEACQDAN